MLDVECTEWKMQGRRIHASRAPLPMSYIADIEDAEQFDPLFMDALATRLAEKLAMPLTGNITTTCEYKLMKALDFIQIFASNVRRLDFRLSSAQVILAVIAGYRRHSTITEATRLHPNTVTNILQDLIAQGYINRFGDSRPYVYRPTADGEQLAGNLLDKNTLPSP